MKIPAMTLACSLLWASQCPASLQNYIFIPVATTDSFDFNGCNLTVDLVISTQEYIKIYAGKRFINRVRIYKRDGGLFIDDSKASNCKADGWFNRSGHIEIGVNQIHSIKASKSTLVSISSGKQKLQLNALNLELKDSARCSVESRMHTDKLQLSLADSSRFEGLRLKSTQVTVNTQQMADARIGRSKELQFCSNHQSSVAFIGNPRLSNLGACSSLGNSHGNRSIKKIKIVNRRAII